MQYKRGTLHFITCFLAATCLTPQVYAAAEPTLSFHPTQKWNIEVSASHKNSVEKTCSISNTFNNGFILKLDGTKSGFKSLEIDFRQDSFDAGKKYEIQYTIPGNSSQVFPTKAVTKNLLVSDVNGQSSFIQNLSQNGVVDLQIQSNSFRLYMTGLGAAMKDHADCVQPEDVPAPQALSQEPSVPEQQEATAPQQQASTPIVAMEEKIAQKVQQENLAPLPPIDPDMDTKIDADQTASNESIEKTPALKPDTDRPRFTEKLAQQMKSEGKTKSIPVTVEKTSPLTIAAEATKNQNLVEKNESPLLSDPSKNPAPMRTFTRVPPVAETVQSVSAEPHSSLNVNEPSVQAKKIETDGAVINKVHVKHAEIDFTTIEDPSTKKNNAAVKANSYAENEGDASEPIVTASQERAAIDAEMLADIEPSSGTKNQPIHANVDETLSQDLRNKIIDLEKQISVLKNENSVLDDELKSVLKDAAEERTTISGSNWDLERATMRYNEAEIQINRLGRQLQSSKSQCEMEKSELKAMLFDPKLTDQQQLAKLSSLEEDLDRTKTDLVVQKRTYEERIKLLEEQLNKRK